MPTDAADRGRSEPVAERAGLVLEERAGRTRWTFQSTAASLATLAAAYADTRNSRLCCSSADDLIVDNALAATYFERGGSQWVYGELALDGCVTMLSALLRGAVQSPTFLDVGAGVGQVVLAAALLTDVSRSIGVEIVPRRHAVAERALAALVAADPAVQQRVDLHCGDILAQSELISDVSHVFIANAVWSHELTSQVVTHVAARSKRLGALATLKEVPPAALLPAHLTLVRTVDVDVSWDRDGWPLHVYRTPSSM